ncbi:regulator of chromosome condensation 1/beta-lactamase-inhibitor protein II [Xylogone sp. PMI_703]|nr:regulator of chromosome condensation 1/beta-lactamase-inhibitor protein II [Xylogone sp. PMI_703]
MPRPVREVKATIKSTPPPKLLGSQYRRHQSRRNLLQLLHNANSSQASKPATSTQSTSKSVIAKPAPNKKRQGPNEVASKPAKRPKAAALNTPPTEKLDIYVCGEGDAGELGLGPKPIEGKKPTHATRPRRNRLLDATAVGVVQIAAGGMHCVSLTHDQKIVTWGVNDNGTLGRDTTWEAPTRDIDQGPSSEDSSDEGDLNPKESTPIAIPTEDFGRDTPTFVQVVASDSASFALTSEGLVYGWGTFRGNDGIWGFSTVDAIESERTKNENKKSQRKPVPIPPLKKIVSLAAGNNHVLALDNKGKVFAWGAGEQNQLGRRILPRTRFDALTPCRLALSNIKQVACGAYHCFAIDQDGRVYAWGLNNFGQTGIQDDIGKDDATIPQPCVVEALRPYKIREIQGCEHHSIACTEDGKLLIWGRCDDGQAGIKLDDQPKDKLIFDERGNPRILKPTIIPGIHAVSVAAAVDDSFAITLDGKAYSWGFSAGYRTGQGTDDTVMEATLLSQGEIRDKNLTLVSCGGQFSVLAGLAGT